MTFFDTGNALKSHLIIAFVKLVEIQFVHFNLKSVDI